MKFKAALEIPVDQAQKPVRFSRYPTPMTTFSF